MSIFENIKPLIDWLKSSPKYMILITAVTAIALFSPDVFLDLIGIKTFVGTYRGYVGVIFLIFFVLILIEIGSFVWRKISDFRAKSKAAKTLEDLLNDLTWEEKAALRNYTERFTKTAYFDTEDGVIGGLENQGIIYKSAATGSIDRYAYNINQDVWDYLKKHPEIVSTANNTTTKKA